MMQKKKRLREFFGTIAIACLLVAFGENFRIFSYDCKRGVYEANVTRWG